MGKGGQKMNRKEPEVARFRAVFDTPPEAVPAGNVDVSGNGRWKIWLDAGTRIDAPILGNGDMTAAFAGPCEYPQFYVSTNDFWQMESAANWEFYHDDDWAKRDPAVCLGSPKPVGRIVFTVPALKNAGYHVEQDFLTATTKAVYQMTDGHNLTMESYVAAEENLLVLRFLSDVDLPLSFEFRFPDEIGKGCDVGADIYGTGEDLTCTEAVPAAANGQNGAKNSINTDAGSTENRSADAEDTGNSAQSMVSGTPEVNNILHGMYTGLTGGRPVQVKNYRDGVISGYREFSDRTDKPVRDGFAACFVPEDGAEDSRNRLAGAHDYLPEPTMLKAGQEAFFVLVLRSWDKFSRPYEYALSRARWITRKDLAEVRNRHLAHWRKFWSVSEIHLDDPLLEQRYYLCQYMLGSLSGDPEFPPNIQGISTFDRMAWNGNYKINYNHQSPYLNLLASGHFREADTHDAPYLAMLDLTREMSRRLAGHEGAYYPLGLGPQGMVSEALLLHMKSPAIHGALNMLMRWSYTYDAAYAEKIYPFLVSVADFWENDLVLREDGYHVVGDGMHERVTSDVMKNGLPEDPCNTLGYLRTFFRILPMISRQLGVDEERCEKWEKIAENIAPYPVGTIRDIHDNPTLWDEGDTKLTDLLPEEDLDARVFYDEGKGGKWSLHFPGNVMQIYPGNAVGLGSDPEELETARNTIRIHSEMEHALAEKRYQAKQSAPAEQISEADRPVVWKGAVQAKAVSEEALQENTAEEQNVKEEDTRRKEWKEKYLREEYLERDGAWNSTNLSCLFFPAAARVGYDPDEIWQELTGRIRYLGLPNGFFRGNPHGIENLNTVPATMQEMMLQSQDGVIRIFPDWPVETHPNASFRGFCAFGAFRVSAVLADGEVKEVQVQSLAGSRLRVANPWPGKSFRLFHSQTEKEEICFGEEAESDTFAGELLVLSCL